MAIKGLDVRSHCCCCIVRSPFAIIAIICLLSKSVQRGRLLGGLQRTKWLEVLVSICQSTEVFLRQVSPVRKELSHGSSYPNPGPRATEAHRKPSPVSKHNPLFDVLKHALPLATRTALDCSTSSSFAAAETPAPTALLITINCIARPHPVAPAVGLFLFTPWESSMSLRGRRSSSRLPVAWPRRGIKHGREDDAKTDGVLFVLHVGQNLASESAEIAKLISRDRAQALPDQSAQSPRIDNAARGRGRHPLRF